MLAPKIVSLHGEDDFFLIWFHFQSSDTSISYISIVTSKLIGSQVLEKDPNLIEHTRLDFSDALLQIKARLLQCTLGTFRDRTGRGLVTLRERALPVLYLEVHDDWQKGHNKDCHDSGNDVDGSRDWSPLRLLPSGFSWLAYT